ncbi:MAG: sigma-70 family RNA polymerase sigma factor [Gammaproteobacteria bacterium]|nr:sigma-70 family RNA polymerase sigma factor [Gammaproteobacteria bacterium]
MDSDETLMQAFARGDQKAFDMLYARHKGPVFRFILRHVREQELANELHQEVWFKLIRAAEAYEAKAKFTTYLYHIANNLLVDHGRRNTTHLQAVSDQYEEDDTVLASQLNDTLGQAIIEDCLALMRAAVQALPVVQRDAFVLQQEGGHSLEAIADITDSNRETIKSRLRFAIKTLREKLRDCL